MIVAPNSVLREHPEVSEALIYDALLVNRAGYAQPFPVVELTLSSMQGELIAGRRFQPAEYLSSSLGNDAQMAPNTPVHISLEMQHPGQAPLNFAIQFR